ncbi:MAG: hypothetical protein ACJ8GN_02035 [Longimicrobiaceae bacterium]
MSRADRRWLLRVWKEGEAVYLKADHTVDVAVAVAHACQVLSNDPDIPDRIREAADALVAALRPDGQRTPLVYPLKKGPPGSAA